MGIDKIKNDIHYHQRPSITLIIQSYTDLPVGQFILFGPVKKLCFLNKFKDGFFIENDGLETLYSIKTEPRHTSHISYLEILYSLLTEPLKISAISILAENECDLPENVFCITQKPCGSSYLSPIKTRPYVKQEKKGNSLVLLLPSPIELKSNNPMIINSLNPRSKLQMTFFLDQESR